MRMTPVALAVAMLVFTSTGLALADDPLRPPGASVSRPLNHKDETTALLLSLGGAAVVYAMIVESSSPLVVNNGLHGWAVGATAVGAVVLPSLGELYAGDRITKGMVLRAVGVGSIALAVHSANQPGACEDEPCGDTFVILFGVVTVLAGTIYDVAAAPSAVQHYNKAQLQFFSIAPTVLRSTTGLSVGAGIHGEF
ncbi:MAG: hypothetical protein JWO36_1090 [Myxococcales bacterium]|nr:hypothetical protein [Myxococcales bacterium]